MATIIPVPIEGTVIEVFVKQGDRVTEEQHLFTVEKGKTLLTQRATVAGTVMLISIKAGDQAAQDAPGVTIE
jgi:pyruvate/2-oxoglutarate dehydrogenase complex dihydrolipoamide acyltransferase (E2) component